MTEEPSMKPSYLWLKNYPQEIPWQETFTSQPLFKLFDTAVAEHPDRICANFFGRVQTYREVGRYINKIAASLQSVGVAKGTKVGLFLPNCPIFIIYYYAALKAGATIVNYNPLYTIEELSFQVRDSNTELMVSLDLKILFEKIDKLLDLNVLPRAIICSFQTQLPYFKAKLFQIFKKNEIAFWQSSKNRSRIIDHKILLKDNKPFLPVRIEPEGDIAVLQYTGGTTGTPKGAMLTHANLYINTLQLKLWTITLGSDQERVLGVLPFFHVFAMTVVMNLGVAKAAEIIMLPRFQIDSVLKLIHRCRPTIMPAVPTLLNAILIHKELQKYDLRSLKFCLSGGAPLPIELLEKFLNVTQCDIVEGYGLSEASPVVTCNVIGRIPRAGSIGLPLPSTVVSLRSLTDPNVEVPQGERGELCVKGPQVMKGYWNREDDTANQFTLDKFLRTGDVAVMDKEGYFKIVDRIKDLIICSGYKVYPRQIEEAIYQHPEVEEVTVIGIPDAYRGEAPKAFIKLKSGATVTKDKFLSFLEAKLSRIEMPTEIEFRDTLPKTMIGKLSKKELRLEEIARLTK